MTGDEIRQERTALGLSQADLASILNVSPQSIRNWESGRRTPKPALMLLLKKTLAPCTCACHLRKRQRVGIPNWTRDEDRLLLRLLDEGASPGDVITALVDAHDVERSWGAVVDRAGELGRSFYRDQYSGAEVARLLGTNHWRVGEWIKHGLLDAERHVSLRSGRTGRWWCIKPSALDAFIDRYAGIAFDPSLVPDRARRAQAEIAAAVNRRRAS